MTNLREQLKPLYKSIRMTDAERSRIKNHLQHVIAHSLQQTPTTTIWNVAVLQKVRWGWAAALGLVVSVTALGGTAFAALESLPGEDLYDIKTAIETTRLTLVKDSAKKVAVANAQTQERVKEAAILAQEGKLDEQTGAILANKISQHTTVARNEVNNVKQIDPVEAAVLAQEVSTATDEAQKIVESISDNHDNTQAKLAVLTQTVDSVAKAAAADHDQAITDALTAEPQNNQDGPSDVNKQENTDTDLNTSLALAQNNAQDSINALSLLIESMIAETSPAQNNTITTNGTSNAGTLAATSDENFDDTSEPESVKDIATDTVIETPEVEPLPETAEIAQVESVSLNTDINVGAPATAEDLTNNETDQNKQALLESKQTLTSEADLETEQALESETLKDSLETQNNDQKDINQPSATESTINEDGLLPDATVITQEASKDSTKVKPATEEQTIDSADKPNIDNTIPTSTKNTSSNTLHNSKESAVIDATDQAAPTSETATEDAQQRLTRRVSGGFGDLQQLYFKAIDTAETNPEQAEAMFVQVVKEAKQLTAFITQVFPQQ